MLLCLADDVSDWEAVLAQDPLTKLNNLHMGLRAQAETRLYLDRQITEAAAAAAAAPSVLRSDPANTATSGGPADGQTAASYQEDLLNYTMHESDMQRAACSIGDKLSLLLKPVQQLSSTTGQAMSPAASPADPQQQFSAVIAFLFTNLKLQRAVAEVHCNLPAASSLVVHAGQLLSALARFGCSLQLGVEADNLWLACVILAAHSCIAAGSGLATVGNGSMQAGQTATEAACSQSSKGDNEIHISKLRGLEILQQVAAGLGWMWEQLPQIQEQGCSSTGSGAAVEAESTVSSNAEVSAPRTASAGSSTGVKAFLIVDQPAKVQKQSSIQDSLNRSSEHLLASDHNSAAAIGSKVSLELAG